MICIAHSWIRTSLIAQKPFINSFSIDINNNCSGITIIYYYIFLRIPTINPAIKERIFRAADSLYEGASPGEFPNVESVRQLSKAGMNNVVEALKEWRELKQMVTQQINTALPDENQNALMVNYGI